LIPLSSLPALNAGLNSASALLLAAGYLFIRRGNVATHRLCMLAALATSTLFLTSYLIYHYHVGSVPSPARLDAPALLHDSHLAYEPGGDDRSAGSRHALSRSETASSVTSASPDASAVVLRAVTGVSSTECSTDFERSAGSGGGAWWKYLSPIGFLSFVSLSALHAAIRSRGGAAARWLRFDEFFRG
jgi:hypothetical protein